MSRVLVLTLVSVMACADKAGDSPSDDSSSDDSGEVPVAVNGLPEGTSTWSGTGDVQGYSFLVDVTLENDGGDLTGTVTVSDDPDAPLGIGTGTYNIEGTHSPDSGVFALGPLNWLVQPNLEIELLGATGLFNPEAGTLSGQLRDYASGSDNSLVAGPFSLTKTSGDGAATQLGDRANALATGTQSFSGTTQCTSSVRDVEGTLTYDGQGGVTGSITLGDPGLDNPLGTFPVDGAHNASTGAIMVAPQPWDAPAPSNVNFMVFGVLDGGTGAWDGDMLTNTDACSRDTWHVTVSGS